MRQEAKVIGISHSKGGVGKSTLIQLLSSFLTYIKGLNVLIIDADPQRSIIKARELEQLMGSFSDDDTDSSYSIIELSPDEVIESIELYKADYDFIFVDLSGTLSTRGNIQAYAALDQIIIPTSTSAKEMNETIDFYDLIVNEIQPIRKKSGLEVAKVSVLLNRVSKNLSEFKKIRNALDLHGENLEKIILSNRKGELDDDYPYEFKFIDTEISYAPGKFGQSLNTVFDDDNMDIIDHYEEALEIIFNEINV